MAFRLFASAALRSATRPSTVPIRTFVTRSISPRIQPAVRPQLWSNQRFYSAGGALSKEDVTARILDVLKSFEKVDGAKLTPTSSFAEDLGLDSLDSVEVVMAVEEEFAIEIPDAEADEIKTVQQAIDYILKTPEAH
ncbi:Acyl carrier protein, mitochondrial [Tulasnella sp. 424]|nr:Acyl carrier protein, mitochondrial [Tulasnella sp. 424]KAG8976239.1 Acyl carrier protein, mitochondrial [Tulasnella sp. 425]